MKCLNCFQILLDVPGKQRKFCSKKCKMHYWREHNKDRHNALMRQFYRNNKEKMKTRQKTLRYIGIPDGLLCQNCHIVPATERHHWDYNNPMDILFVCKTCNEKLPSIN